MTHKIQMPHNNARTSGAYRDMQEPNVTLSVQPHTTAWRPSRAEQKDGTTARCLSYNHIPEKLSHVHAPMVGRTAAAASHVYSLRRSDVVRAATHCLVNVLLSQYAQHGQTKHFESAHITHVHYAHIHVPPESAGALFA